MKLELKCNFFSNFTRLNFFVTPLGNTVKLKMQKWIQFLQKTPTLWGMKFFSSSSIFFKIIIFHFLWLLLKSLKCRQWNDKNFKMFTLFLFFAVAPQIRPVPQNGRLVVYQGEAATLGCDILRGNPTPEIKWRRKVSQLISNLY